MPRSWILLVVTAGTPLLASRAAAQTQQERCTALQRDLDRLSRELDQAHKAWRDAGARLYAVQVARGPVLDPLLTDLLRGPDVGLYAMERFATAHQLPDDLRTRAKEGVAYDFWKGAVEALEKRCGSKARDVEVVTRDLARCSAVSEQGPLPIGRHPAGDPTRALSGQPIITDELVSRWLRAWYAELTSGGAYWQAGRMTQQDYREVTERIRAFTLAACLRTRPIDEDCAVAPVAGTLARSFAPEELEVFHRRRLDLANAIRGNWSQVRM